MALSMYDSSIPALKQMLNSLAAILAKAAEHAEKRGLTLLYSSMRLFPDVFPNSTQARRTTSFATMALK